MLISTKGRYALRVMIDLAEQGGGRFVPLKEIADLTGFEHVEYLCVVFKRLMGEPPGCYRKRMQVEKRD